MQQFIVYRRVSTEEQGRSGLGMDAQRRDIDLFLANYAEEPWEVIADLEEVQSGKDSDRPILTAALELARKTRATILVSKLDRLSRSVAFVTTLMEDKRVTFRVASMPQASDLELQIYAMLAEQERKFISLRTKATLAEVKAKGKILGGLRDKTGERNKAVQRDARQRADTIAPIILPMREQGHSLREIAAALNKAGVRTARDASWTASQVMRTIGRLRPQVASESRRELP